MKKTFSFIFLSLGFAAVAQFTGGSGGGADSETIIGTGLETIIWDGSDWSITGSPQPDDYVIIQGNLTIEDNVIFSGMNINETYTVTVQADNSITLTNSLRNDGVIQLEADMDGKYAMLKFNGAYEGSGTISQEQKLYNNSWHMVASPMNTTNSAFFGTVGTSSNPNSANLFSWDGENYAPVYDDVDIVPGSGYYGYVGPFGFRDTTAVHSFEGIPNTTVTFPTLTASNVSASNDVTMDGNENEGWSMLGNPFTCALDFESLTRTDIEDAFYIFDPQANGGDGGFVEVSDAGIESTQIAPLQAFWVRSIGSNPSLGSATMQANGTIPSSHPDFYRSANTFDRVVLRSAEVANPQHKDHTVIALIEGTTDGFDNGWDARKMIPSANTPGIFTVGDNQSLANNAIDYGPNRTDKKSIDLSFMASNHGETYSITFDEDFMVNDYSVYLEDKRESYFHNLKSGAYVFANDTANTERFVVHFRSSALSAEQEFTNKSPFRAWVSGSNAYIKPHIDMGRTNISLVDMGGRNVYSTKADLQKNDVNELPLPTVASGIYLLHIDGQKPVKVVVH